MTTSLTTKPMFVQTYTYNGDKKFINANNILEINNDKNGNKITYETADSTGNECIASCYLAKGEEKKLDIQA